MQSSSLGNLYTFLVGDPQKKGGRVDLIKKSVTIASTDSVQKSVVTCFAAGRIFFRTTGDRRIFSTKNCHEGILEGENLGSSDFDAQNLKISISTASFWGWICVIFGLFGCSPKKGSPPKKTMGRTLHSRFWVWFWSMESWNSWKRIKAEIFGNKHCSGLLGFGPLW